MSTKFLGVPLAENFTCSISKKALQRLYFLGTLRKAHFPPLILTMIYRWTIESTLSNCITAWFRNCTISYLKTLLRIVWTAEKIIGVSLPIWTFTPHAASAKPTALWASPHTPHTHSSLSCYLKR
ncbi:hypothetical protein QTP70_021767, partial [Hemibagrus guttatus]